ncbi:MAG: SMI1/KNR4 family protein [Sandaracinaceae bacterium]|nr:SMI1/KNR4 family protein [Sandaracinaceae bacterium]
MSMQYHQPSMHTELQRLLALIETRDRALRGLTSAPEDPRDDAVISRLGEPASHEAIARLESVHGALPAAYRAFLTLHDGWQGFPTSRTARLFSCDEFASDEGEEFAAQFRSWRGNKTNREVQTAFVIGGGPGIAYVLLARPTTRKGALGTRPETVRTYSEKPLSQGDARDFVAFLERTAHLLNVWYQKALESSPAITGEQAWALVDEAIVLFNDADDNGERVDESASALRALRTRLDTTSASQQRALLTRMQRELYPGGPYTRARRVGDGVELFEHAAARWVRVKA